MAAKDNLHPYQYKLFMQAKDLMNVTAGDGGFDGTLANKPWLRQRKLENAKQNSAFSSWREPNKKKGEKTIYESIKERGIVSPVSLGLAADEGEYINDGHHRVTVANELNPEMYIPIRYQETF
jgi:hypothetical protein